MSIRIDSFLAKSGYCARRKVAEFLKDHHVCTKDGPRITEVGMRVSEDMPILIDGKNIKNSQPLIYIMLNKPAGYLSSSEDPHGRPLALDLIPEAEQYRLYSVGRLDFDSSGLLLFTNDGDFSYRVTHPRFEVEKEYIVRIQKKITSGEMDKMCRGVVVDGEVLKIARYKIKEGGLVVEVVLVEGKNREIRRLFRQCGNFVKDLKRIRIGSVKLADLETGKRRVLSKKNVAVFKKGCYN